MLKKSLNLLFNIIILLTTTLLTISQSLAEIYNDNNTELNNSTNVPSCFFYTELSAAIKNASGEFFKKKVSLRRTT